MSHDHQFWLAKLDQHGNPTLIDGSHLNRSGVEKAMYLFNRLHLSKGENYACAEVIITPVDAKAHGANEDAIETLNAGRSTLRSVSPQPLLDAPRVKALEWEPLGHDHWRAPAPLFGSIRVENYGRGFSVNWSVPGLTDEFTPGNWGSADEAKAAAQSYYEQCILAALQSGEKP